MEKLLLLRKVYIKLGRDGTFTKEGIHKTWWSGYLYIKNLLERVLLLRKVYTKLGGKSTFTE